MISRRTILKSTLATGALAAWGAPLNVAFASIPTEKRLVFVILRGAMDGLAAVPPYGDPDYKSARGILALDTGGASGVHDLDGHFGLHPAFNSLYSMWQARELMVFHNIALPYHNRSHFDGQNVLETGGTAPHVLHDGWLNRALKPMGLSAENSALAIAPSLPLLLSGPTKVSSWMPDHLPEPDAAFFARVRSLYANDAVLKSELANALENEAEAEAAMDDKSAATQMAKAKHSSYGDAVRLFDDAGKLLAAERGPRVAVFDVGGWDTHVNEGAGTGQLARRLQGLDAALAALKTALGPAWKKTAVVMATEFGRTVRPNGNGGTDHGTAGAAFLMGGSVSGHAVKADWVGLKPSALKDGRDQPARTDLRSLLKGVLGDHMHVARRDLETTVFPDSGQAAAMQGLFRA